MKTNKLFLIFWLISAIALVPLFLLAYAFENSFLIGFVLVLAIVGFIGVLTTTNIFVNLK